MQKPKKYIFGICLFANYAFFLSGVQFHTFHAQNTISCYFLSSL